MMVMMIMMIAMMDPMFFTFVSHTIQIQLMNFANHELTAFTITCLLQSASQLANSLGSVC